MTGFGSTAFTDPNSYPSKLMDADVRLVVTDRIEFGAEVSWLRTRCLRLFVIEENAPRVAFIALSPSSVFVSFPLVDSSSLTWNGVRLKLGDLVLHAPGERFHQRTTDATRWGLISLPLDDLERYVGTLLEVDLPTGSTQLFRPSARSSAALLRLQAQASRLARIRPGLLARREVSRALEQELIHALVTALGTGQPGLCTDAWRRRAEIMVRFEDALAAHDHSQSLPVLCASIGVPARTLRAYCAAYLGCSPLEYAKLRRLNLARLTLLKADPDATSVAEVARSHGFLQPGRFAGAYRRLFGEAPLATLLRRRSISAESA
jgi:AraC-like DNA-binding protein